MSAADQATTDPKDPSGTAALGLGFASAKLLLSALELGVFTVLDQTPDREAGVEELRAALGLHPRAAADFFDALVALGLLERTSGRYRNGEAARRRLVRGEDYAGGFLEGANLVLYPAWGKLTQALRTGAPQAEGDFEAMLSDPAAQRVFLAMQDSLSAPLVPQLLDAVDLTGYTTLVDVGGARGNLAGLLLRACPQLTGRVFDRPQNAGPCAEHAETLGVAGRLDFTGGDFFADDLPEADVMVIGHVLADFSQEERKQLIGKAYKALRPGGTLLVYDPMPGDKPDLASLVASLHMLVMTPAGAGYHPGDCAQWMRVAGFTDTAQHALPLGNTLVTARKTA
ncbi:acetylserotonin O-methyltransferase [Streptomyces sp. MUM 178J]|uniref:acetylserotonin O-methyltransferase n=1 Tax=Streptomyces sp. MUM 178J TaxID=2791991 RepID=UPI001F050373|nr:acetylserotonin O-methyltransferase [Streptomyces sp. MUM 178J]WRQ80124.1 methyltransferase [Streptomyces sp. MUM 178J]